LIPQTTDRRILVAGRSGQLARCLLAAADDSGFAIACLGRPELDVEDEESIDRAISETTPCAIINAAAYTAVDLAESEPERAFGINERGAGLLADRARRSNIPLVHFSTDYVFDGTKRSAYVEEDVPRPINVYGSSKLAGEARVLELCPHAVVIRTSWVYSPYGSNFVRTMARLSQTQSDIRVVADQYGAPTSATELAAAALNIAEQLLSAKDRAGVYHVVGGGSTSWHGFAAAIFSSLSRRGHRIPTLTAISTEEYPTAARRPRNSRLNASKADRVFGVRLPSWQLSLEKCLDGLDTQESPIC
jgi:dTDP-4-dehydrorhamnose reductase